MNRVLPVSEAYRKPILDGVAVQIPVLLFCGFVLDGGDLRHICGVAFVALWTGVALIIWRRPQSPRWLDLQFIRFGILPLGFFAYFVTHWWWHRRGLE